MAGNSINTLYKTEKGQANPTIKVLNKIAGILGMEVKPKALKYAKSRCISK